LAAKDMAKSVVFPFERIESTILVVRGQRIMLDADLAALYDVETRVLVQAVKRNLERFPADFMFRLTEQDVGSLRSQSVISSSTPARRWGGRRSPPYAFTEQGVAMLSSVLRSARAIAVNVEIMRAFVRLRTTMLEDKGLAYRLDALEARMDERFSAHDLAIAAILQSLPRFMAWPEAPKKRKIGFVQDD
jgi:ORF6N domain-containing protein